MKRLIPAVLLFAVPAFAQDAATVALEQKNLDAALKSAVVLTRATAARVALVRSESALVPQLRDALAAERDAVAARELIRAIVILGSDDDVAFAASQLPRFPASIDGDFAAAVARLGAPRATTLYLKHVAGSRKPAAMTKLALWGRADQADATAARLLGANDANGFGAVLSAASNAGLVLDSGVLTAALGSNSDEVLADTIWYLVRTFAAAPSKMPESLRERATAERPGAAAEESLGRELLRRMLGAKAVERQEWLDWLREVRRQMSQDVRKYLTPGEVDAADAEMSKLRSAPPATIQSATVKEPDFQLPIMLPNGLAEAILAKTRCRNPWIGVAGVTVDRAGRVQAVDLKRAGVTGGCAKALETMLRLSLADPEKITSPFQTTNLLVVKPRRRAPCFDEDPVSGTIEPPGAQPVGGEITAPKVLRRTEPVFPQNVRREMPPGGSVLVTAEAIITRTGCVRDVRLIQQTQWPQLNAAAVLALSEWTFEPGKLDGLPVDVIFHMTVRFRLN